jgi:predicted MFS family arabinose efflux permease
MNIRPRIRRDASGAGQSTAATATSDRARPNWAMFTVICLAYFVTTTGEQMLGPIYPTTRDDMGWSVGQGGIAFGTLTGSIAVANLIGGSLLARRAPSSLIRAAGVVGVAGSVITATSPNYGVLLIGQVLLGTAAGLFFPAGLQAVGVAAGPARRGFAMGIYGVAFSGGLTMGAVMGAVGAEVGWRVPFWIASGLFAVTALGAGLVRIARPATPPSRRVPIGDVLTLPTWVGCVLAVLQYGSIPFLTTFAVDNWHITAGRAATILIVGRLLSIVAKVIGGASADRIGARASARRTGIVMFATGIAWLVMPAGIGTYAVAAVFAASVSSLGPVANILAVERFGQNGMALGMFRSVQIAMGALASAIVGVVAEWTGLRPTLTVAAFTPLALLWICRPGRPESS